jgi:hypothetical protein
MGISSSNLDFVEKVNGCKLGTNVIAVDGLSSSSASPSDQWILTLQGAFYGKRPIRKAFMKWFIHPEETRRRMTTLKLSPGTINHYVNNVLGLEYEIKVYRDIISPLIVNHVCPNFIRFLADGDSCNRTDILDIVIDKTKKDAIFYGKKKLSKEAVQFNIDRNIAYIFTARENRPSINDDNEDMTNVMTHTHFLYDDLGEIGKTDNFNLLITEAIVNERNIKTITLYSYLSKPFEMGDLYKIFFQMIFACYAMTNSGMNHMDMHAGNVYIEITKTPVEVIYVTDLHTYRFMTNHKVLVYDFDFSYVESLGDNAKMKGGNFARENMTNDNFYTRDIAKCSYYVWGAIHDVDTDMSLKFLDLIANDRNSVNGIIDVYKNGGFLQRQGGQKPIAASNWTDWADHNKIFSRLADESFGEIIKSESWLGRSTRRKSIFINESEILKSPPIKKHERVFVCSPRMFKKNGELDIEQTQSVFNDMMNVYKKL